MLFFSSIPSDVQPQRRPVSKPGTYWRRQNLIFLERWARRLEPMDRILDVGAGTGYFRDLFAAGSYMSVDFNPYPGMDIICDFTITWPFKSESVDVVVLGDVLEHVSDGKRLLGRILECLKPDGVLLITVPFMIKIHQAPYDFVRYTHFGLSRMLKTLGFEVEVFEAVYEPAYLARTTLKNLLNVVPQGGSLINRLGRMVIWGMWAASEGLLKLRLNYMRSHSVVGTQAEIDPFPLGYHLAARRNLNPPRD